MCWISLPTLSLNMDCNEHTNWYYYLQGKYPTNAGKYFEGKFHRCTNLPSYTNMSWNGGGPDRELERVATVEVEPNPTPPPTHPTPRQKKKQQRKRNTYAKGTISSK